MSVTKIISNLKVVIGILPSFSIDKMSNSRFFETITVSKVGCPPKVICAKKIKIVRMSATHR
jgi:hypothetical protein